MNRKSKKSKKKQHAQKSDSKKFAPLNVPRIGMDPGKKAITTLSARKKLFFSLAMILVPVVFLLMIELALRAVHYGGDIDLVLTTKINGTTYCYINKKVARRFFSHQDISIPDARTAIFKKKKSIDTYRIFCLGGSTTAGFPFQYNATFPCLLKDRLDVLFPEKNFEVINVGISAINSYSVLDFTKELVNYDPDLFIIYMGHNEFYGALGIGSTQQIGHSRNWVLFYMKLQKIRLFNLIRNIMGALKGNGANITAQQVQDQTLMERVVKKRLIGLNSKDYQIAHDYFEKNLTDIVKTAQEAGALVIGSTLVSNLADQEPFEDQFLAKTTAAQQQQWQEFMTAGYELEQAGKANQALVEYHKAEKIDPTPASLYFRRAKCLQMTGNIDIARKEYVKAKDYDGLRFRASEDFNQVIRQVGSRYNIPIIDMEKVFAPYCRDEILDRTLFTDHLHPHFPGYFWMAQAFCTTMAQIGCIVPPDQWDWSRDKSTNDYRRLAGVTDLDLEIANQRIRRLTSRWPFKKEFIMRPNSGSEYDSLLESTVKELYDRKFGWNEAHYRIARYFHRQREYDKAAREYEAVIKVTPFNYFPYLELGELQLRQQKYQESEQTLKKALAYSRHLPYANAKLGMLYFFSGRLQDAVDNFHQAIALDKKLAIFNNDELAGAWYMMSMAYGQLGQLDQAKSAATTALKLKPDDPEVRAVLDKLDKMAKGQNDFKTE